MQVSVAECKKFSQIITCGAVGIPVTFNGQRYGSSSVFDGGIFFAISENKILGAFSVKGSMPHTPQAFSICKITHGRGGHRGKLCRALGILPFRF